MSRFQNIIVAVDGSGSSEQMTQTLLKLPLFGGSKITLLHAVPSQISAEQMRSAWEKGQKVLAAALDGLVVQPGVPVTTQLIEGDPKVVVCDVAQSLPDPLIVMGSRGQNRLAAILQNSVSQYVFQLASCPMLLVKDDIFIKQTNRVLVALDGSAGAQRAFELAVMLIRDVPGGQLSLVKVQLDTNNVSDDPILTKAIDTLKRQHIAHRVFTAIGDPGTEIIRVAGESGADLLVMGSPDRRPSVARNLPDLDRLLGKSTSDYVRVHAECPVLMVRSSQDKD
ncbi:MAG: universal stress protein [Cyanobacteriota bacterium]|nr:universal stress protein [Cyanobacteriota bacterium]